MAAAKATFRFAFTAPVVMAHPTLITPRKFGPKGKETGEPKFSANFIFDPASADLKALKDGTIALIRGEWPTLDIGGALKEKKLQIPFSDGTDAANARAKECEAKGKKADGEYQRGKTNLVARTKHPPRLAVILNGKVLDLDTEALRAAHAGQFFFGAEVLAQVTLTTHDAVGANPPGVNAYLDMVLATGKGERLAGGASASEVFKGYAGSYSAENPNKGPVRDDEIPF